jgi:hypothetical protein
MDALAQFLYSAHRLKSRNISLAITGRAVIKNTKDQLELGITSLWKKARDKESNQIPGRKYKGPQNFMFKDENHLHFYNFWKI